MPDYADLIERLENKAIPEPNSGCWLWMAHARPAGYGVMWFAGKLKTLRINWHLRRAARLLWLADRHHSAVKRLRRRIAP